MIKGLEGVSPRRDTFPLIPHRHPEFVEGILLVLGDRPDALRVMALACRREL